MVRRMRHAPVTWGLVIPHRLLHLLRVPLWGDRYAGLEDPFGHKWGVATHQREVTQAELEQAIRSMPR